MYDQFLGHYLVETNKLTLDQLNDVIEAKKDARIKLGFLAVNEGFITEKEANKINELQKSLDMRFGDIAVNKGFLTQKQVDFLLRRQGVGNVLFIQTIVDKEYMTLDSLNEAIENYKVDYELTSEEYQAIETCNITTISDAFTHIDKTNPNYLDLEPLSLMKDYFSLFLRNIERFITSGIRIEKPQKIDSYNIKCAAQQMVVGDGSYGAAIAIDNEADSDSILTFATIYGKESFTTINEDTLDALGEFINCVNGLYTINLENSGIQLDMEPQQYLFDCNITYEYLYKLPIYIDGKHFDMLVFILSDISNE